ncbi:glycosyltransferase family 4 protein [Blastococcus sp. SYSU DS1021]
MILLVQGHLTDVHSAHPWTRRSSILTKTAARTFRRANGIAVPTSGLAQWLSDVSQLPVNSITVLPNGVDLTSDTEDEAAAATDYSYAVFTGQLATWQGVETMLQALRQPEWPTELHMVVVGDGPQSGLLREASDPRLHWVGQQSAADAKAWLRGAIVALSPKDLVPATAHGAHPFKVLDAAAAGVPMVATSVPGQKELIEDLGIGLLVGPGDPGALASAVARVFADADLRRNLSERGRENVERFGWSAAADDVAAMIERSLDKWATKA